MTAIPTKPLLPVTVLSGFLGAGKTTMLKYILNQPHGMRIAVIVNDMSEINIDARLIESGTEINRAEARMVEMSNGCICCTLREDLLQEITRLAQAGRFEYLLIESTGISEPLPVAETFTFRDEHGTSLSDIARLDTMVTVVDAASFAQELDTADSLKDRGESLGEEDERTIADLLIEQVEFADVIVVNKADLLSQLELQILKKNLQQLNREADIVFCSFGEIPLSSVLGTGKFNFEKAQQAPGWLQELNGSHTPETEEYGIGSFVYRAYRPFHPRRFFEVLHRRWPGRVLRAKGFFWLATRPTMAGELAQAGGVLRHGPAGYWHDNPHQELVFIGQHLDATLMQDALDRCLLCDEEMELGLPAWAKFEDFFPEWE